MFPFVPICDDAMSSLTYLTFWALITGIGIGGTGMIWWHKREICRIEGRIDMHDTFVNETLKAIGTINTNSAVTMTSLENIEESVKETRKSIAEINRILLTGGR